MFPKVELITMVDLITMVTNHLRVKLPRYLMFWFNFRSSLASSPTDPMTAWIQGMSHLSRTTKISKPGVQVIKPFPLPLILFINKLERFSFISVNIQI